jgi:predicted ATPase
MIPRIRTVQIKNYKSLAAVSVQLEPFTVLVGPNGSGKSNFIDALAFVQECLTESAELAVKKRAGMYNILSRVKDIIPAKFPARHWSEQDRAEYFERSTDAASKLSYRFVLELGHNFRADYSLAIAILENGQFSIARERCIVQDPNEGLHEFEIRNGRFIHPIEGIAPIVLPDRVALYAASATKEFRPVYDFLASMRFYSIVPDAIRQPQDPDVGYYLKKDGSNAAAVLKNLLRYGQRQPEMGDLLTSLLGKIADGVLGVQHWDVGNKETLIFSQDIGLPHPQEFAALNMSDGTLRALGVLLAVFQPGEPKLVGIEEPEATVHPAIIEMVMDVLMAASKERQVLITTHSPEILNQKELHEDQLRLVTWQKGQTIISPPCDTLRDVIREQLYQPGELLSVGELKCQDGGTQLQPENLDLFGAPFEEMG